MSFLDRIASAVMPAASEDDRRQARQKAQSLAQGDDWLTQVIGHHQQIEAVFATAYGATGREDRAKAARELGRLLTGHSVAEEAVLYPAVVEHVGKTKAAMAFEEQSMTKIQMAELEKIDPMSEEWRQKLEHIESAVQQHVYQEEDSWYPELIDKLPAAERAMLTSRYAEEFGRYCGIPQSAAAPHAPQPS